ncbi:prepilin-type N-terminal cleavage/methylation domain-containing protein [Aestuariibacter sp. AA17]|uniref:Prepilin-type N-terminal cleavage/methylation domain-containing protein n=1 Tax=Fluctibacter corallii TaxID=2984329 RepID=A0ABT3A3S9_9ALTE|nr:prepilin-type N-terminal cleavage/methylation domain-containing protein [Aestuariibacter sp. AA17]MCV2883294.1 prepilin-type N-terminal cleavage/methylation domain-containing protein [Aestuariibacter sp. AA17]
MSRFNRTDSTGFSLIELLVVMSIVTLLMSLVGPLVLNQVEKTRVRVEVLELNSWLAGLPKQAIMLGSPLSLSFNGKQVAVKTGTQILSEKSFSYLFFKPADITYSRKGLTPNVSLDYQVGNKNYSLQLGHIEK